jgi:hypothetical protein
MQHILGEEIEELIKQGDIRAIKGIKADYASIKKIQDIQVKSTGKKVWMDLLRYLEISDDGSKAWGISIFECDSETMKCKLVMHNFETGNSLVYNYQHQNLTLTLTVSEDLNLAVTGGFDDKIVLHCLESGKTLKVLDLGIGALSCFYKLGSVVAIAGEKQVIFFDLLTKRRMKMLSVEVDCVIRCMQLSIEKSSQGEHSSQSTLFVGASDSTELIKIILPKKIAIKSNLYFFSFI